MIKRMLTLLLILTFVIGGLIIRAEAALPDITPANSLVNPVFGTLFVVHNASPSPKIITFRVSDDPSPILVRINYGLTDFPTGSKIYGTAVSSNGRTLYVSINNGSASAVRSYSLDENGRPFTSAYTTYTGAYWPSYSSPAGLAANSSLNRLYVADKGTGRIRVFNTATNQWVKDATYTAASPHFGIAYSSNRIYVSNKSAAGKIMVYSYVGDTITYITSESFGTGDYPSYIKVVGNRLYVAVHGTNGVDIKVYSTTELDVYGKPRWVADIKSGVTGAYGWTGFDISVDGTWLIFNKALNAGGTDSRFYAIATALISGPVTADEIAVIGGPVDSAAISFSKKSATFYNSPTGNEYFFSSDVMPPEMWNHPPTVTALEQYKLNGTTSIPVGGITKEKAIKVQINLVDEDAGDLLTPLVTWARDMTGEDTIWAEEAYTPVAAGSQILRVPAGTTNLIDGKYSWYVRVRDAANQLSDADFFGGGGHENPTNPVDFIIDTNGPDVSISSPVTRETVSGNMRILARAMDPYLLSNVSRVEYFINTIGINGAGTLIPTWLGGPYSTDVMVEQFLDTTTLTNGIHTLEVHSKDVLDNWGPYVARTFIVNNIPADITPPAAITDLRAYTGAWNEETSTYDRTIGAVTLKWTAVGDDGIVGTATAHEIRHSATPITDADSWNSAVRFTPSTLPQTAGLEEIVIVEDAALDATIGQMRYFAVRASDEVPNQGPLSNGAFTFVQDSLPKPLIEKIYPKRGPNNKVNNIIIKGSSFAGILRVYLEDTSNPDVQQMLDFNETGYTTTMILATVPAGLSAGIYEVKVEGPGGTSDPAAGNEGRFTAYNPTTTPDTTAPDHTTLFAASNNRADDIQLTWVNPNNDDLASLEVRRRASSPFPSNHTAGTLINVSSVVGTIPEPGAAITFNDTSATPGTTYYYAVYLGDTANPKNWNTGATQDINADTGVRVISDTTSPATVIDFNASDDADTQSVLTWTNPANTDLRQVIVLRKEGSYPTDHEDAAAVQVYQTMIPEPGANVSHTDDNGVAADTIYYYAVFSRDTSDNWNDTVDFTAPDVNADTRTPGGGVAGEVTLNLYHVDQGNLNRVALPFTDTGISTTVDLGNTIAATFTPQEGDNITLTIWDPSTQTGQQTTGDYVGGAFIWDPVGGQPLTIGNMYQVSIYRANRVPGEIFTTNLTIRGNSPADGSISLPLYHVDQGNLNWVSIPWYTAGLTTTVDLGNSVAARFTPAEGDNITITIWDPSTQTGQQATGDYVGGALIWDPVGGLPVERGKSYAISIYRAGRPMGEIFTFTWPN